MLHCCADHFNIPCKQYQNPHDPSKSKGNQSCDAEFEFADQILPGNPVLSNQAALSAVWSGIKKISPGIFGSGQPSTQMVGQQQLVEISCILLSSLSTVLFQ